jgi:hypothetical protein
MNGSVPEEMDAQLMLPPSLIPRRAISWETLCSMELYLVCTQPETEVPLACRSLSMVHLGESTFATVTKRLRGSKLPQLSSETFGRPEEGPRAL